MGGKTCTHKSCFVYVLDECKCEDGGEAEHLWCGAKKKWLRLDQ